MVAILTSERQGTSRLDHLEALMRRYPDVNPEVIVKEDTQREGFLISQAAIDYGQGAVLRSYQLFSWDQSPLSAMEDQKAPIKLPNHLDVEGGPYALRRTIMRPRINGRSPYLIDVVEGAPKILDRATRQVVADIRPWHKPPLEYFNQTFSDGTPFPQVMDETGYSIVFRQCQHWGPEEECKFCDINENARTKKLLGQVASIVPKKPEQVAICAHHLYELEDWSRWPDYIAPYYLHLNGGTVTQKLQGKEEHEFYLQYVDAIRARIGYRVSVEIQTAPWPKRLEKIAHERGTTSRSSNFEVWDPRLFHVICPGKERYMGRDEWLRRMVDQVDIFGVGHVVPGFVAGVEMAQPWGFKTVGEAVRSTTEGMEFFMSHGIVVRPISWCVEALSALAGQTPPPVDYFIQIDRNWYDLYRKYSLPPQHGHAIGPGKNTYPNSGAWDMEG